VSSPAVTLQRLLTVEILQLYALKSSFHRLPYRTTHNSPQHTLNLFQPAVSSPAVTLQRLLTVEILQLHALKSSLHRLPYITQSVARIIFKITPRHGPGRNTSFTNGTSIVARQLFAAWTGIRSCCVETDLVCSPTSRSSHSNGSTSNQTGKLFAIFPTENLHYRCNKEVRCPQRPERRIQTQFGEPRSKQN
jgi:hypothetical protein